MFRPYLAIFRQFFTFRNCRTAVALSQYISLLLHIVVHTKTCLFENETLRSALFSFCGVHVSALLRTYVSLVGSMSHVSFPSVVSSPVDVPRLTSSQAGGYLTQICYSSNCRLKTLSNYIVSARIAQKTSLSTFTPLLCVKQPLPSNGCFSGCTVLSFKY
jgi:hypothetical protein